MPGSLGSFFLPAPRALSPLRAAAGWKQPALPGCAPRSHDSLRRAGNEIFNSGPQMQNHASDALIKAGVTKSLFARLAGALVASLAVCPAAEPNGANTPTARMVEASSSDVDFPVVIRVDATRTR